MTTRTAIRNELPWQTTDLLWPRVCLPKQLSYHTCICGWAFVWCWRPVYCSPPVPVPACSGDHASAFAASGCCKTPSPMQLWDLPASLSGSSHVATAMCWRWRLGPIVAWYPSFSSAWVAVARNAIWASFRGKVTRAEAPRSCAAARDHVKPCLGWPCHAVWRQLLLLWLMGARALS